MSGRQQGAAAPTVARLAGFAEHGHCPTASLAFTEGYDLDRVLQGTGYADPFGQSQFMFERGRMFERLVKQDTGDGHCRYGPMLELLRHELGFEAPQSRIANLRQQLGAETGPRARRTRQLLADMAAGRDGAINLVDGAVVQAQVAGILASYEADGLAFRVGGRLHVVEIKSFAVVDGYADPVALAAALDQGALYILLVQRTLEADGFDPSIVSDDLALITPRNVGLSPCLNIRSVAARIRRIARLLDDVPAATPATGPARFAAVTAATGRSTEQRIDAALAIADDVGARYDRRCRGCGLYRLCRERAFAEGSVDLAGDQIARQLAGIGSLGRAAALADGDTAAPLEMAAARQLAAVAAHYDAALARPLP